MGKTGAFVRLVLCRLLPLTLHHLGDPDAPRKPKGPVPRSAWDLPHLDPAPSLHTTYIGNAARCFTAADTVPPRAYTRCAPHLRRDLEHLLALHSEVILLALGAPAASSVLKLLGVKKAKLSTAFSLSGRTYRLEGDPHNTPIRFFATYHPAHILRNHNMIRPFADHLAILRRSLSSNDPPITSPTFIPPLQFKELLCRTRSSPST